MCPLILFLALIGCPHIKPMIIGNYLSLNKKRKMGLCVTDTAWILIYFNVLYTDLNLFVLV